MPKRKGLFIQLNSKLIRWVCAKFNITAAELVEALGLTKSSFYRQVRAGGLQGSSAAAFHYFCETKGSPAGSLMNQAEEALTAKEMGEIIGISEYAVKVITKKMRVEPISEKPFLISAKDLPALLSPALKSLSEAYKSNPLYLWRRSHSLTLYGASKRLRMAVKRIAAFETGAGSPSPSEFEVLISICGESAARRLAIWCDKFYKRELGKGSDSMKAFKSVNRRARIRPQLKPRERSLPES